MKEEMFNHLEMTQREQIFKLKADQIEEFEKCHYVEQIGTMVEKRCLKMKQNLKREIGALIIRIQSDKAEQRKHKTEDCVRLQLRKKNLMNDMKHK